MSTQNPTHITIVIFTAFNNPQTIAFEDAHPIMAYSLKRRIRIICPTSRILKIKHYEARILMEEVVKDNNNGNGAKPIKKNNK